MSLFDGSRRMVHRGACNEPCQLEIEPRRFSSETVCVECFQHRGSVQFIVVDLLVLGRGDEADGLE